MGGGEEGEGGGEEESERGREVGENKIMEYLGD